MRTCRDWRRPGWGWLLALATFAGPVARCVAEQHYSGTIFGAFSDPILSGDVLVPGGHPLFTDNGSTAAFSIVNSSGVAEYRSGSGQPSTITFQGASFADVAPSQEFELGTIRFFNGTSRIDSLTFGVILTLWVPDQPSISPTSVLIRLQTTVDDSDSGNKHPDFIWLPIGSTKSQIHIQNGTSALTHITGRIIGDPRLYVRGLSLDSSSSDTASITAVPLPGTLPLAIAGVASWLVIGRRRVAP